MLLTEEDIPGASLKEQNPNNFKKWKSMIEMLKS